MSSPNTNHSHPNSPVANAARRGMAHWVAAIADRIRNPIASIGAGLDIMEREFQQLQAGEQLDQPKSLELIAKIRTRLASVNSYITELAEFAQPAIAEPEPLNVEDTFAGVLATLKNDYGLDQGIDVQIDAGCSVLYADREKIQTIFVALIMNGIEAVKAPEKPAVTVHARTVQHANARTIAGVRINVTDNGGGFSADALSNVFQPFYSSKDVGTGLGLAVVKKYMDAITGEIEISNNSSGKGAEVSLFFPEPEK